MKSSSDVPARTEDSRRICGKWGSASYHPPLWKASQEPVQVREGRLCQCLGGWPHGETLWWISPRSGLRPRQQRNTAIFELERVHTRGRGIMIERSRSLPSTHVQKAKGIGEHGELIRSASGSRTGGLPASRENLRIPKYLRRHCRIWSRGLRLEASGSCRDPGCHATSQASTGTSGLRRR
jgi:hypothetical protein